MSQVRSHRLSRYATLAHQHPVVTGSLVVAAAASPATADLKVWSVGQMIPRSHTGATADLQLMASFNTAFKVSFWGTNPDQGFHAANGNMSFINYTSNSDRAAMWGEGVTFFTDALDGMTSLGGYTGHSWYQAGSVRNTDHDLHAVLNHNSRPTGAVGIRFDAGGGNYHYGWIELTEVAQSEIRVERWALETQANTAAAYPPPAGGAVPGLGGLAALACGAAGMRRSRQRVA